jgi:hypothetical protein
MEFMSKYLNRLQYLNLYHINADTPLHLLSKLTTLRKLEISCTLSFYWFGGVIPEQSFYFLSHLISLQELHMEYLPLYKSTFQLMSKLLLLHHLECRGCSTPDSSSLIMSIDYLDKMSSLECLKLYGFNVDSRQFEKFASLCNLHTLTIDTQGVEPYSFRAITCMSRLTNLDITNVAGEAAVYISTVTSITYLK